MGIQARSFPKHIRIANSASGNGWTTRRRAQQYVDQLRAVWTSDAHVAIQFHVADLRHQGVLKRIFSDGGRGTLKQIKGLPVVGDVVQLLIRRKPKQ